MKPVVFLPLTKGQVAIIDVEDFEFVGHYKWYAQKSSSGNFYAARTEWIRGTIKHRMFYLHCEIMGAKGVDHKDGNGLNCRRENMRLATSQQNSIAFARKRPGASSAYRGVTWRQDTQKWMVRITASGRTHHVGCFESEEDAARSYDIKASELGFFNEALNFPLTSSQSSPSLP